MSPEQAKDFARLSQAKPGAGTPKQDAADVSLGWFDYLQLQ